MDQAIKAALDKYHGKQPAPPVKDRPNRAVTVVIAVIVLVCAFALCVKYGWFHTDRLWEKISSFSVGGKTVGQIFGDDPAEKNNDPAQATAPLNPTGQSGTVEPSQTVFFAAGYLDGIRNGFSGVCPVEGTLTCSYGRRIHPVSGKDSFHRGIDIGAAEGKPVCAFRGGTVDKTGRNNTYGNYILLSHGTICSFYGHLSRIDVRSGDHITSGQTIGAVGSTGVSTGPHLHFEIRNGDESVDPLDYIKISS